MSGSGSKGHAPSTPEQVAECQKLIEAHGKLLEAGRASRPWPVYQHTLLTLTGSSEHDRIYLPGVSWPWFHKWLHDEAARIKDELFNKFGIEVT